MARSSWREIYSLRITRRKPFILINLDETCLSQKQRNDDSFCSAFLQLLFGVKAWLGLEASFQSAVERERGLRFPKMGIFPFQGVDSIPIFISVKIWCETAFYENHEACTREKSVLLSTFLGGSCFLKASHLESLPFMLKNCIYPDKSVPLMRLYCLTGLLEITLCSAF